MVRRLRKYCLTLGIAVGLSAFAAPAFAIGYYNLPGNFCQCFGYGNGAGHHSCMVLGPSNCYGFGNPHEVRVPYPPQPPCNGYGYGNAGCGNYGGDYYRAPEVAPPSEALPPPSQAAMRPQILR